MRRAKGWVGDAVSSIAVQVLEELLKVEVDQAVVLREEALFALPLESELVGTREVKGAR